MTIKGINLGGWLLMEGYILGGRNIPESVFKNQFKKANGKSSLVEFERLYRGSFITEDDFKNIKALGANTARIPFHYKVAQKPAISCLEQALNWADKYNLKIILDLHAACGPQNEDWHSDSSGRAILWDNKKLQKQTCEVWQAIASQFKDKASLLGYDILNEPVIGKRDTCIVKELYQKIIKAIRAVDTTHIIFLEGDIWAQRIDFLKDLIDENIQISIHTYQPIDYVFNFTPFSSYPGKITSQLWDKSAVEKHLEPYYRFSQMHKVNIYVGEFGINWRQGYYGELNWLSDMLSVFSDYNFGYTYWTYKAMANSLYPDGIYQYIPNFKYVHREGPVYGWENYPIFWQKEKAEIIDFFNTKNFTLNNRLAALLSKHFTE